MHEFTNTNRNDALEVITRKTSIEKSLPKDGKFKQIFIDSPENFLLESENSLSTDRSFVQTKAIFTKNEDKIFFGEMKKRRKLIKTKKSVDDMEYVINIVKPKNISIKVVEFIT